MIAETVREIVERELDGNWSLSNPHGVDCCRSRSFGRTRIRGATKETSANRLTIQLWLVLEERPAGGTGYSIVYDAKQNLFGLASGETFIGYYGSSSKRFRPCSRFPKSTWRDPRRCK